MITRIAIFQERSLPELQHVMNDKFTDIVTIGGIVSNAEVTNGRLPMEYIGSILWLCPDYREIAESMAEDEARDRLAAEQAEADAADGAGRAQTEGEAEGYADHIDSLHF